MRGRNLTNIVYRALINKRLAKKVRENNDFLYYYVCAECGGKLENMTASDFFRNERKKLALPTYEQVLRAKRSALEKLEEK